MAHFASRADVWVENGDRGAALLALVDEVRHLARITTEAIKPSDNQLVAGA